MYEINSILVPVDFSGCSRAALEHAVALADRFGAAINVLHVWEPPRYVGPESFIREPGESEHPLAEAALAQAKREMDEFVSAFAERSRFHLRFESGKPHQTIVKLAEEEGFDAIVMGTHGRTGLPHILIGSVAEKVVRTAPCPVMTIRERAAARSEAARGGVVT